MEIKPEDIQRNIQQAQKGDQQAFTFLLDLYWNEVYGFMLKRTENEADTDDIVIQTFAKAFDKIETYNPDFGLNTWLIAITKNVHIDLVRKKKKKPICKFKRRARKPNKIHCKRRSTYCRGQFNY